MTHLRIRSARLPSALSTTPLCDPSQLASYLNIASSMMFLIRRKGTDHSHGTRWQATRTPEPIRDASQNPEGSAMVNSPESTN